jgi:hypothetical protein
VLNVPIETWMGHAAAVLRGAWGAVPRRAHPSGESRTAVDMPAQRVVHAVARAQAGGSSDEALGQAWAEAEELSEATPLCGLRLRPGLASESDRHVVSHRVAPGRGAQARQGRARGAGGDSASGASSRGARFGWSGARAGALARRNRPASRAWVDGD